MAASGTHNQWLVSKSLLRMTILNISENSLESICRGIPLLAI